MVSWVCLVHTQTHHFILGLGIIFEGVHVENSWSLTVQRSGNVEGRRSISSRCRNRFNDQLCFWSSVEQLQEPWIDSVLKNVSEPFQQSLGGVMIISRVISEKN